MTPKTGEALITEDQIRRRVAELAAEISADYAEQEVTLVCVLRGSFIFLADLIRQLSVPARVDFMAISSYGSDTKSTGVVRILKDLEESIDGEHVLVVEDVIDSGLTLAYLLENLGSRNPASLRVCALLDKAAARKVEVPLDYVGFTLPDRFVVGYGLDHAQRYRGLPYVAALAAEVCEEG